jgi:hypothetical protein
MPTFLEMIALPKALIVNKVGIPPAALPQS